MARFLRKTGQLTLAIVLLVGSACRKDPEAEATESAGLTPVQLQLDWFPEPAHGGFYQALKQGFYEDVGLAVEILPGGPGGRPTQKVASGQVPFSMGRSDDMMLAAAQGLPVLIVAGLMQHDPQALLLHEDNPVNTFADLDGRAVMAYPGAAWIPYLQKRFDIKFDLHPMSFGLARFIADPNLIQACFVTDEPFRLRQEGVPVKTLLLSDSGYDPYRVIVAHRPFAEAHPEIVRAFVAASIRGWQDYIRGNPAPAHDLISRENDHMTQDQMVFSHSEMIIQRFVDGDPAAGEEIGALDPVRLNHHAKLLHDLGVLETLLPLDAYADLSFLPDSE
ncbi:MAG: ABC transporter substrate-binding protein [Opitutaceae bacterium]|jgi:NitT/TauT family transport system substrate-binding protein|nr:ABC transporter substrate-binding protein [Opitutaceae bacterium]